MFVHPRLRHAVPLVALGAFLTFAGCSHSGNTVATPADQNGTFFTSVPNAGDSNAQIFTSSIDAINDGGETTDSALASIAKSPITASPVIVEKWGRKIDSKTTSVQSIAYSGDSLAYVTFQTVLNEHLVVSGRDSFGTAVSFEKGFVETLLRRARFVRIASTDNPFHNWRLEAVTLVYGGTSPPAARIDSLTIMFLGSLFSIVDADSAFFHFDLWWKGHGHGHGDGKHEFDDVFPEWDNNGTATILVAETSPNATPDIVSLHFTRGDFGLHRVRFQMTSEVNNGDGTFYRVYQTTFRVPGDPRKFRTLGVSSMTSASITDDQAAVQTNVLGMPFIGK
jgi:hypothetical protein